jgi:hypothetical protein
MLKRGKKCKTENIEKCFYLYAFKPFIMLLPMRDTIKIDVIKIWAKFGDSYDWMDTKF